MKYSLYIAAYHEVKSSESNKTKNKYSYINKKLELSTVLHMNIVYNLYSIKINQIVLW